MLVLAAANFYAMIAAVVEAKRVEAANPTGRNGGETFILSHFVYFARGCAYVIETFDSSDGLCVSVECYQQHENVMVWAGSTNADATDRVIDLVRRARNEQNAR